MKFLQAILMGIIQGLTEFLPVSSSGHLALIKAMFGMESDSGVLFDVLLHVATLVAICVVFYKDILRLIVEFIGICRDTAHNIIEFFKSLSKSDYPSYTKIIDNPYRRFVMLLIVSTIPTGIIGLLMDDVVDFATTNLLITGVSLICTGLILVLSDFLQDKGKRLKEANYGDAFSIGVAQGIATLPGISRSGTTITAGILCGFDRKFAAKYSFIMSMPAILGALLLELTHLGEENITGGDVGCYIVGMIIAGVIGYFALKITMKFVINKYFKYFAFYCMGIGFISIIVHLVKS